MTFDDTRGLASTGRYWWARSVVFPGRWVVFGQGVPVRWYVVDDFGALAQVRVRRYPYEAYLRAAAAYHHQGHWLPRGRV